MPATRRQTKMAREKGQPYTKSPKAKSRKAGSKPKSKSQQSLSSRSSYSSCSSQSSQSPQSQYQDLYQDLSPDELVLLIMEAIYWDINAATISHQWLIRDPTCKVNNTFYNNYWNNAKYYVHKSVYESINQPMGPQERISLRHQEFIKEVDWKHFTICAHAEAFLQASIHEDDAVWKQLTQLLIKEKRSLDVFARVRNLKWKAPLLTVASHLPDCWRVTAPEIRIAHHHPHELVICEDDTLRLTRYNHKKQINIEKQIYRSELYDGLPDPTLRKKRWGPCDKCDSPEPCDCVFGSGMDLVELREYPGKGVGVRALANIRKGDYLAEFIGEFIPDAYTEEGAAYHAGVTVREPGTKNVLGTIAPARYGNWTRYINHSCESLADFVPGNLGKRTTVFVVATQDIPIFTEITIHYGDVYWNTEGRKCLCGSHSCVHRDVQDSDVEIIV